MTGYLNSTNYLSAFSVASLADLGYDLASDQYADLVGPLGASIDLTSDNPVDLWIV